MAIYTTTANPRAPTAKPDQIASPNLSFGAAFSALSDAGAELVEVVSLAAVSAAPSSSVEVTVVEPLALITLVTVDCCADVCPSSDEVPEMVVRKVEVMGLVAAAAPVASSPSDEDGVADRTVKEGFVPFLAAAEVAATTEDEVAISVFELVLVPEVAFASSESDATQVSEPTFTVLVLSREGLLLVKGLPASPVPFA